MARVNVTKLITDTNTTAQVDKPAPAPARKGAREPTRKATDSTDKPTRATRRRTAAPAPQKASQAATEQPAGKRSGQASSDPPEPDGIPGEKRITLPLWHSLWRALQLARVDDGVDTTVRIRAMVELWEHDTRVRARVDKLAKQRASTLPRGRPRREDRT